MLPYRDEAGALLAAQKRAALAAREHADWCRAPGCGALALARRLEEQVEATRAEERRIRRGGGLL